MPALPGWLRIAIGLPRVALHIVVALVVIAFGYPFFGAPRRDRLLGWWSRRVLAICGVTVRIIVCPDDTSGEAAICHSAEGAMLVMNHISWIDIYVVHTLRPAHFVAKAEIAAWPVIGYLTARTGTVFIERGKRRAVHDANRRVAEILVAGGFVAVFPEGTTTDGASLLPFHANLIQPAIDSHVPLAPVALRYVTREGARTRATAYIGDTNLFESMLAIMRNAPIVAELHLLPAIDVTKLTRHEAARAARAAIAATLGLPPEPNDTAADIAPAFNRDAGTAGTPLETPLYPRDELL